METKYKYFIEDTDTNEWYWSNPSLGLHRISGNCQCIDCSSELDDGFTNNPQKAFALRSKLVADIFLMKMVQRQPFRFKKCIVTEHEFI